MRPVVDAGALLDSGPWTTYQKLLTSLAAIAIIFDGFDIQILGFAIPSLMQEWKVTRAAFAPVAALGLAGMIVGGPLFGNLGDRYGRRMALIGAVLLFGMATIATAFSQSVEALAALRFLTGMGAGGAVPNAGALAAEFVPARRKPMAVKLTIVCIPLGGMLGGFIAAQVLPAFGWRALYLTGGIVPVAFALLLLWPLLPESPRFLAQRESGWPELARFLRRCGHTIPAGDLAFEDRSELRNFVQQKAPIRALLAKELLRDTTCLWLSFFSSLFGVYLIFSWLPALLSSQGLDVASSSSGLALYNFGGVTGVLLWTLLMSLFGSRGSMIWGSLGAAVSAAAVLLVPPAERTMLLAAIGLHGLLANAVQTSMWALASHVYPTAIRATGLAFASAVGRCGALLSSLFGAAIITAGPETYWGAVAAGMLCATVGLALVRRHVQPVSPV